MDILVLGANGQLGQAVREASQFVQMVEKRLGVKMSAPEEIVFKNGWIDKKRLLPPQSVMVSCLTVNI